LKKQEESAKPEEEAETMEQCISRHMAGNEELTEEAARALCEEERKPKESAAEEKGFIGKISAVIDEVVEAKFARYNKELEDRMQKLIKDKENEAIEGFRKSMGLEKDPTITLSEAKELIRKILLEQTPHGKKSETLTKEKPIEGETGERKLPSAEDLYKKLMKDRGIV
jgi:hypothetical protein